MAVKDDGDKAIMKRLDKAIMELAVQIRFDELCPIAETPQGSKIKWVDVITLGTAHLKRLSAAVCSLQVKLEDELRKQRSHKGGDDGKVCARSCG